MDLVKEDEDVVSVAHFLVVSSREVGVAYLP